MECSAYVFKFSEVTRAGERTLREKLQHTEQHLAHSRWSINIYCRLIQITALENVKLQPWKMSMVKLPKTKLEICFRNQSYCTATDLQFPWNRREMGPLTSSLRKIPLGVRHESKYSGMIPYLGKKDTGRVLFVQQIFTELLNVSGSDYPAMNRTVLGCAFWSTWSLCSIIFFFSFSKVSGISQSTSHVWIHSPAIPIVLDFNSSANPGSLLRCPNHKQTSSRLWPYRCWTPELFQLALKTFRLL